MDAHRKLVAWARKNGITMDGIEPRPIPGRGIGMVATRALEANHVILDVPTPLLRTLGTVPRSISRKLPRDMSVHGLLAADLALDSSPRYEVWNAVMPTREDLETSVPLAWPPELQSFLPDPAQQLLRKQQAKYRRDWDTVRGVFPGVAERDYRYAWLLVNTRTFYYTTPKTEKLPRDDRMVLQPVADLFNHADEGCSVAFDARSFTIQTRRGYAEGEEVFICYGRHSNDFLLAEYGFVPPAGTNRWDEVGLDEVVLPRLSPAHCRSLNERGFLGNYKLDKEAEEACCFRTQVALRILCMPLDDWGRFVDGLDDGQAEQPAVDRLLVSVLQDLHDAAVRKVSELERSNTGGTSQREMLLQRWEQIDAAVTAVLRRLRK
ncbi:hypothetical protein VTK73DRAFT_10285 [Phialemonium thermophilum]|uniref:SET domain-containing protein n=1 Tax=Phialemonium thermophilum TaxID=223376 RepID=A0ABR3XGW2_9PEZI